MSTARSDTSCGIRAIDCDGGGCSQCGSTRKLKAIKTPSTKLCAVAKEIQSSNCAISPEFSRGEGCHACASSLGRLSKKKTYDTDSVHITTSLPEEPDTVSRQVSGAKTSRPEAHQQRVLPNEESTPAMSVASSSSDDDSSARGNQSRCSQDLERCCVKHLKPVDIRMQH